MSRKPKDKPKDKNEGMSKFGVTCTCPHGTRPPESELKAQEDGSFLCPVCGRTWPK